VSLFENRVSFAFAGKPMAIDTNAAMMVSLYFISYLKEDRLGTLLNTWHKSNSIKTVKAFELYV
jgi:hypothetical protein